MKLKLLFSAFALCAFSVSAQQANWESARFYTAPGVGSSILNHNGTSVMALPNGGELGMYGAPADKYPLRLYEGLGWNFTLQNIVNLSGQYSGFRIKTANPSDDVNDGILFQVRADGKVGIGTTPPRSLLDVSTYIKDGTLATVLARQVEGDAAGEGTFLGVRAYGTQFEYDQRSFSIEHSFYGKTNSSINFHRGGGDIGGSISFNTHNNTERMRIEADGNVGIGTSDPKGYKLAVAGNMIAESVKVKPQGAWPDYVFTSDYQLQPLNSLESFINENRHLPGIPSAVEVAENGIDLGEMDKKLLKKIEELTLYIIQLEKKVQAMDKKMEAQDKN